MNPQNLYQQIDEDSCGFVFLRDVILHTKIFIIVLWGMVMAGVCAPASAWESNARALGSLQSFTGIFHMPTARILPDWNIRVKTGYADPWAYYGGALGVFDRFEFHGQFTRTNTITAFPGYGYGDTKDRSAGMRAVLIKENEIFPQISAGFYDATGNGFFSSRYIVASKMFKNVDVTLGIGQGILAGEYTRTSGTGESFLTSDPFRKIRLFGGFEWHLTPKLTFAAEYSSIDRANMYGYRDSQGKRLKDDNAQFPVNLGVKYKLTENIHAAGAWMQGDELAGSIDFTFPLKPEGFLAWKKTPPYEPVEKLKWEAHEQDNEGLAAIVADQIKDQGFKNVSVACTNDAVWVEYENNLHLSDARSLGHVGTVCDKILPRRIQTFYLNIKQDITVLQSLKMTRGAFTAFMDSTLDAEGLLTFSEFHLYQDKNWNIFQQNAGPVQKVHVQDSRFSYSIKPKIQTFLNNKTGFFKHKGFLRARAGYRPWYGGQLNAELQWPVFNEYDEIDYDPLEKENAVRTDLLDYESTSDLRISMLSLDQKVTLPMSIQSRFSAGIFESAYAGFGAEVFRYFHDGLWGVGLETEWVRKRDPDNNFQLRGDPDKWYTPAFLNLYSQILPSMGVEGGLKIGRFLAGDFGIRVDLRRSFKYFTIGGWYTRTDTDMFKSPKNRGSDQAGVYIRVPFSIFRSNDKPGHFSYAVTSFTLDSGALVRQPDLLYPMHPWSTTDHTRRTLNDMRTY
jgi:hypothetical protein